MAMVSPPASVGGASALDSLRGQTLSVPDLSPVYAEWRHGVSPHYARLAEVMTEQIRNYTDDERVVRRLEATDFALLTSMCYPDAEWPQLKLMGQFLLWLFVWDDEVDKAIDACEADYASDLAMADEYRKLSLRYVNKKLGGSPEADAVNGSLPDTLPAACTMFGDFSASLVESAAQIDMERFGRDLQYFVESNREEQLCRMRGELPTVDHYWSFRHGTGAMDALNTLTEFAANTHLPKDLAWGEEVYTMRLEISRNVILMNDMLSLKKEIEDATPTNIVAVLMHHRSTSLAKTIDEVVAQLKTTKRLFDGATQSLRAKCAARCPDKLAEVERFIGVFETFQTGLYKWSLGSPRYRISSAVAVDGSIMIKL
jgi:hypothetical protein